jgi:hypothetical protein
MILNVSFGFGSFASSFLWEVLDENIHYANALPMLGMSK